MMFGRDTTFASSSQRRNPAESHALEERSGIQACLASDNLAAAEADSASLLSSPTALGLMKMDNRENGELDLSLADFVEQWFIPEHVLLKRSAGRSHFYWMLKLILTPERVDEAFRVNGQRLSGVAHRHDDWPYVDNLLLTEVTPKDIDRLVSAGLARGYSVQTVTHMRNVVRCIFAHAAKTGVFKARNPATLVQLPEMVHGEGHSLTMPQLSELFAHLRYPERELAMVAVASGMSIAEICGLQWKHVNLFPNRHKSDGEWLSPRMIAVRKQSYRAEIMPVMPSRRRDIPISDVLAIVFGSLRKWGDALGDEDFVFVSRNRTPVSQENLGARRLKPIGTALGMPWLSWSTFHRTHLALLREYGSRMQSELKRVIPFEAGSSSAKHKSASAYRRLGPAGQA